MRRTLRSRLTYANVTATLALFLALTGGVYAASKINGSKIKKESIAGKKLKDDGVTGAQINEATLGKVPSAENADRAQNAVSAQTAETATSAQTAASAQTLAGTAPGGFVSSADVKMVRFDVTLRGDEDVTRPVLELGPLTLTAFCDHDNLFGVFAASSAQGAGIDSGFVVDTTAGTIGSGLGTTPLVIAGASGSNVFHRMVGEIVYNDPQTVISLPFTLVHNSSNGPNGQTRCFFTANATRTSG